MDDQKHLLEHDKPGRRDETVVLTLWRGYFFYALTAVAAVLIAFVIISLANR